MASTTTAARQNVSGMPDIKVSARQLFGIDTDMEVNANLPSPGVWGN